MSEVFYKILRLIDRVPLLRGRLDIHMHEVIRGASVAFVLKVAGAALAIAFNVLLARLFGAEGAGVYYIAITVAMVASVIGRVGLDNCLLRFVSSNAQVYDWGSVKSVSKKGMRLALATSAFCAVLVFATAPWIASTVLSKHDLLWPIRMISFAIVPFSMLTLYSEMLKGLKQIRDATFVQGVGVQGLSLAALYIFGRYLGVSGAILAYIIGTTAMWLTGFWLWRSATSRLSGVTGHFDTGKMLASSMPLFWSSIMGLAITYASIMILSVLGSKSDIGIFGVAFRMASLISFLLVAVNSIAAPKFAALYRLGDMKALGTTARGSAKLLTVLAFPALILFLLFPSPVMGLFGSQFRQGGVVLSILAVGQFVNVATGSVGYLLMMSGNERILRNNLVYVAVINLLLNLLLIPRFGVTGAAVATTVSVAFQNLYASYQVYRKINILTIPWLYSNKETLN